LGQLAATSRAGVHVRLPPCSIGRTNPDLPASALIDTSPRSPALADELTAFVTGGGCVVTEWLLCDPRTAPPTDARVTARPDRRRAGGDAAPPRSKALAGAPNLDAWTSSSDGRPIAPNCPPSSARRT